MNGEKMVKICNDYEILETIFIKLSNKFELVHYIKERMNRVCR